MRNNSLVASLPTTIGKLDYLVELSASSNRLNGTIPTELSNIQDLRYIYLHENNFGGGLPSELGRLTKLIDLRLENNTLTGTIPSTLANLQNLGTFMLFV